MALANDPSMRVNREWATRPADEKYLTIPAAHKKAQADRAASFQGTIGTHEFEVKPKGEDLVLLALGASLSMNNWSAGQLAALSGIPLSLAAQQPAELAARNFNWGLRARESDKVQLLVTKDADLQVRAMTGPTYGRIWDDEVLGAMVDQFGDGVTGTWRVPGIRGKALKENTPETTTIFYGQRGPFVFLADEENRIEVKQRRDGKPGTLARGFYITNSQVGAGKLRIGLYLYDFLCENRIIWGMEQFQEIAIRHSAMAPSRWLTDAMPQIKAFASASAKPMEAQIKAAQQHMLGSGDQVADFLNRRFTKTQTINMQAVHIEEEGRPVSTRWDAVTAATAYAKSIPWQDERFAIERKAGELLVA